MHILRQGVEQRAGPKSFYHSHDYHFIARVLDFQYGLVKPLYIVLQALYFLLVDGKEVGGILLPNSATHEVGDKESARSLNESIIPGGSFLNHDLPDPFKVAKKTLHIISSEQP